MNEVITFNLAKVAILGMWFGIGMATGFGIIWCAWLYWQDAVKWIRSKRVAKCEAV